MSAKESRKLTERSLTFKKKDSGIDKRTLRAHRRSIEWKQRREETVNLRRGDIVSPLSPLKELNTNMETVNPGPVKAIVKSTKPVEPVKTKVQKAAEERREMLEKWRKEKELKKKLEAQQNAKKKTFKVAHVDKALISSRKFNDVTKPHPKVESKKSPVLGKGRKALPKSPKLPVSANKRVTRSQTSKPTEARQQRKTESKVSAPKKEKTTVTKSKPQVTSVPGRQTQSAKDGLHSQVKNVNSMKKQPAFQKPSLDQHASKVANNKKGLEVQNCKNGKVKDSVTCFRGTRISSSEFSFAPTDFKFSAPSNLQSFVFQPLSPASAAEFLVPGNDLSKLTPPSTKRCSTPISQTKMIKSKNSLLSSESSGEDSTKTTGKKAGKRGRSRLTAGSKEPVLSVEKEAVRSPKTVEPSPEEKQGKREDCVHTAEAEDTVEHVEKKSPVKAEPKKTPGRRKSLRKSHASEPMFGGKSGTQSVPDDQLYGSKALGENCNVENQPPTTATAAGGLADNVFKTPGPCPPATRTKRARTRSLGTALLLSNSAKKFRTPRNNRNSLILSTLSPEEGVKVLENSPMVVLNRRTPKLYKSPAGVQNPVEPVLSFDDIDEELGKAAVVDTPQTGEGAAVSTASSEDCITDNNVKEISALTNEHSQATLGVDKETEMPLCVDTATTVVKANCVEQTESEPVTNGRGDSSQATLVVDTLTEVVSKDESTLPLAETGSGNSTVQRDVPYFRQILVTETQKLQSLCEKWEDINSSTEDLKEEARGQIRTAIGKAQLLMAQRFKQFSGLVDNCEFKTGEKETTCTDLEGFWEMIYFQVEDVHNMFADLDKRQAGGWQSEEHNLVVKKKVIKKKTTATVKPKPGGKSKFAEFRAKMKQQQTQNTVEVVENKTFVSGIFRIDSPVKSIAPHCEGGSPGKMAKRVSSRNNTPCGSPLLKAVMERNARKSRGPSPLLLDSTCPKPTTDSAGKSKRKRSSETSDTPAKVSRMECDEEGTIAHPVIDGKSIFSPDTSVVKQNKRRSLRRSLRKSVTWDKSEVSASPVRENTVSDPQPASVSNSIMSQFLQPSDVQESDMEVDSAFSPPEDVDMSALSKRALKSEFDKHSSSAKKGNTPRRRSVRLLSAEKSLSSQRKARRTVHFSGSCTRASEDSPVALKMPVTPFNRDSIVPRTRSSRNSVGSDCLFSPLRTTELSHLDNSTTGSPLLGNGVSRLRSGSSDENNASPATRLAKLNMSGTPKDRRRSTRSMRRVSGFTPPQKISPPVSTLDSVMETADLMSFSPGPSGKNEKANSRTPRRSLRPRVSLL